MTREVGRLRRGAQVEGERKRELLECERGAERSRTQFSLWNSVMYMNICSLKYKN